MPKFRFVRSLMSRPFWWPTSTTVRPSSLPSPVTIARSSAATAIAVQLEEVVEDPLDVVERVRPVGMARELDRLPDLLGARLLLELVELILEPLELACELRTAQELHAAELTEPLAQPHLRLARHHVLSARNLRMQIPIARTLKASAVAAAGLRH